jgi:hypothetical protein
VLPALFGANSVTVGTYQFTLLQLGFKRIQSLPTKGGGHKESSRAVNVVEVHALRWEGAAALGARFCFGFGQHSFPLLQFWRVLLSVRAARVAAFHAVLCTFDDGFRKCAERHESPAAIAPLTV